MSLEEKEGKLEDLCEKYPVIFSERDGDVTETCMARGFEHEEGWYELLDELCSQLTTVMDKIGVVITAEQVKEKFATLRFYYSLDFSNLSDSDAKKWTKIIGSLVSKAELNSAYVCERCGASGKHRSGGWIKTLCDKCHEKTEAGKPKEKWDWPPNNEKTSG